MVAVGMEKGVENCMSETTIVVLKPDVARPAHQRARISGMGSLQNHSNQRCRIHTLDTSAVYLFHVEDLSDKGTSEREDELLNGSVADSKCLQNIQLF